MVGNVNEVISEKVGAIEFKMLSPQMIKKMSVVKIITPELYDADGYPIDSSLMDLKMGVIDPGLRCRTCGAKVRECPGHFGYIELARPVLHIRYVPMIYTMLRSTCSGCGRILMSEKDIDRWLDKFQSVGKTKGTLAMWNVTKLICNKTKAVKKCPHCATKQERIKFAKPSILSLIHI